MTPSLDMALFLKPSKIELAGLLLFIVFFFETRAAFPVRCWDRGFFFFDFSTETNFLEKKKLIQKMYRSKTRISKEKKFKSAKERKNFDRRTYVSTYVVFESWRFHGRPEEPELQRWGPRRTETKTDAARSLPPSTLFTDTLLYASVERGRGGPVFGTAARFLLGGRGMTRSSPRPPEDPCE